MIAVGSDHRGYRVRQRIMKFLKEQGYSYKDFGSPDEQPVDYPDVARLVGEEVSRGEAEKGILVCGTGIGVCIAANKIKGIRAAMCYDTFCALRSRQHNNANILCLPGDVADVAIEEIVKIFLETEFEGGRHQRRVDKIIQIENR
ncbi:MAG: ribose 5-phosphate isomerase B [Dehalococcoidales bacterium]|nr:ribose 5-phosphate isomerase B [Dehalococcoidales bacterium]MDD4465119.1 ribose 5-phosphate isomerase B [Dehalococcoidales bacterium]MDD5402176.1 ribose 5-phosphate isomerase B [Dehalococcoidales bacterium]